MSSRGADDRPTMPDRIAALPRNRVGYPIPWFVAWVNGEPDFRIVGEGKLEDATRFNLCWVCGVHRGVYGSFTIGPMCAVNRVSSEPPSHRDCAVYAARACPFLTRPEMRRRDAHMPDDVTDPAGMMIRRNPGVALVWTSRTWLPRFVGDGILWHIGKPTQVEWFACGRTATREEVLDSLDSGLPELRRMAEEDGSQAVRMLDQMMATVLALVPTETEG